jgi:hypothetical protein
MEFKVKFSPGDTICQYPIYINSSTIGLNDVDIIRAEVEAMLPISRIMPQIDGIALSPIFTITEEQARQTPHFRENCEVSIRVPKRALNIFCFKKVVFNRDEETGEISSVWISWGVDRVAIFDAWLKDECPLEWAIYEEIID